MPGAYLWAWDGAIFRKVECDINGYLKVDMSAINLGDLGDVTIAALADGHFISYSAGLEYWQNRLLAEGDIPAAIARDAEVANAITAHAGLTTGVHAFDKSCRATHSAHQAIPDSTWTYLDLDSELWDTDDMHDLITNNSRLTCKTAGTYIIIGTTQWDHNITGYRRTQFMLNRAANIAEVRAVGAYSYYPFLIPITFLRLAVGDFIELHVYQNSGGNLNVLRNGDISPWLAMARIA